MDIIEKLEHCDFGQEIYHSDGFGHIQVQLEPAACYLETPGYLLEQVEEQGLWPEFFALAKTMENAWILRICQYLYFTDSHATRCFVEFLDILTGRDPQIQLIQNSPLWHWDANNAPLLEAVITKADQLIASPPEDALVSEIDLSILQRVVDRLKAKRAEIGMNR